MIEFTPYGKEYYANSHFPGLLSGEEIIIVLRKHPLTLIPLAVSFLLVFCIPFIAFLAIVFLHGIPPAPYAIYILAGQVTYLLIAITTFFCGYINNRYNIGILTNYRLLDINQSAFGSIRFAEVALEDVRDVRGKVSGILGRSFNYGRIIVDLGSQHEFIYNGLPDVYKTVRIITELHIERLTELQQGARTSSFSKNEGTQAIRMLLTDHLSDAFVRKKQPSPAVSQ